MFIVSFYLKNNASHKKNMFFLEIKKKYWFLIKKYIFFFLVQIISIFMNIIFFITVSFGNKKTILS